MDIEEKLKIQSEVENNTSGNLINDRRVTVSTQQSEEVGVIEVNWRGLYEDCKYAWITVAIFMVMMLYGVWGLSESGYFESKKIEEEMTKVKILEVTNFFGKKILISGEVTKNIPTEIRLPQKCIVDSRWINHEVELKAIKYQNNHTKISSFQFEGVENLCDSTEGYIKAKKDREKMKELVNKISSYDVLKEIIEKKEAVKDFIENENKEDGSDVKETLVNDEGEIIIDDIVKDSSFTKNDLTEEKSVKKSNEVIPSGENVDKIVKIIEPQISEKKK